MDDETEAPSSQNDDQDVDMNDSEKYHLLKMKSKKSKDEIRGGAVCAKLKKKSKKSKKSKDEDSSNSESNDERVAVCAKRKRTTLKKRKRKRKRTTLNKIRGGAVCAKLKKKSKKSKKSKDESDEDSSDSSDDESSNDERVAACAKGKRKRKRTTLNKIRGGAVCAKLKKLRESGIVHIDYNKWDNPCAPNGKMYASYLGLITRQNIPVNIRSWPIVDDTLKEKLWQILIEMFDVPIDKKWAVLRHASSLWRNWKCTLNTDYVQPRRLTNPESMRIRPKRFHKIIKRKEWNEFVDLVTSPRFMKRSAEQKAKKAMQKYAPITGRGGMTGVFDKLVLEGVLDPQRSDVWMRARMNDKGEPIDVRLIPVFKKINELKAEQAAGTLVLGDQEDILSRACGFFNLPGYLVGGGLNATKGMLFPPKKLGAQNAEIIRLRNLVNQLESRSEDLDAHNSLAVKERELFESNQRIQILTRELEILKGINQPYIPQFDEDPLPNKQENEPTLTQLLANIRSSKKKDTINEFLDMDTFDNSFHTRDTNVPIIPIIHRPQISKSKQSINVDEDTWLQKLRIWTNVRGQLDGTMVHFPKEIYGSDYSKFCILTNSIINFLRWRKIDSTLIAAYTWRLHEKIDRLGYMDQYGFVNPMAIADFKHCAPVQERAIKLANFLSNRYTHDKLYLVPYLHEKHWMLILINPSANTAQWCNSFGGSPRPQAIELTERALIEFHHRRGNEWDRNSLTWTVVDVPNQPGLTECALCVMRYMSLIISSGKRIFSDKLENRAVYKREHFSALKEEWAEFFMSGILPLYQVKRK
ncbi:hypothetical protein ACFE04_003081 [Oxalis oulophora]